MAADQLDIDSASIFDNIDEHRVEFDGEVDGDDYRFAVQYDVLEALTGDAPDGDAAITFDRMVDVIKDAALAALSRDSDPAVILVTESDLDQ